MNLDEDLETAGQLILRARTFYDIWFLYKGADTRPKYIEIMNEFAEFFRFDEHAHFAAMIACLAQLFETRSNTLNLHELVRDLRDSASVQPEVISLAEEKLIGVAEIASKVAVLRSNLFAHRNRRLSYPGVFKKAAITPNQLGELTDTALATINVLRRARELDEMEFSPLPIQATTALLQALGKANAG